MTDPTPGVELTPDALTRYGRVTRDADGGLSVRVTDPERMRDLARRLSSAAALAELTERDVRVSPPPEADR